jgi:fatty-acyl-CoA synthase
MLYDTLSALRTQDRRGHWYLDDKGAAWLSYADLIRETDRIRLGFRRQRLRKGDRVVLMLPDPREFIAAFLAAVAEGVVPVPLSPLINVRQALYFREATRRVIAGSGARAVVTTAWLKLALLDLGTGILTFEQLASEAPTGPLAQVPLDPEDPCFIQYTSGSTGDPKGVVVTHRNLDANARGIIAAIALNGGDIGVCWLPLFHDMGLIGNVLTPLFAGNSMVYVPTLKFIRRPLLWLETLERYRGTVSFAPNFAYGLVASHQLRSGDRDYDLSQVRVLGCGAEPIHPAVIGRFLEVFRPMGLRETVFTPCYRMAEATLAVTFEGRGRGLNVLRIDRKTYEAKGLAQPAAGEEGTLALVSCGRPLPGFALKITGPGGESLPDGAVGEIWISGSSVSPGYFQNLSATQEAFSDGWLRSGDLGFLLDGNLYVSGRKKDVIIVRGRNLYPQDIEWIAESVGGVRKGNVVAFAGALEEVIVVAEIRPKSDAAQVAREIMRAIHETLALAVKEVVCVAGQALPKTTSGKVRREQTKAMYREGRLSPAKPALKRLFASVSAGVGV